MSGWPSRDPYYGYRIRPTRCSILVSETEPPSGISAGVPAGLRAVGGAAHMWIGGLRDAVAAATACVLVGCAVRCTGGFTLSSFQVVRIHHIPSCKRCRGCHCGRSNTFRLGGKRRAAPPALCSGAVAAGGRALRCYAPFLPFDRDRMPSEAAADLCLAKAA